LAFFLPLYLLKRGFRFDTPNAANMLLVSGILGDLASHLGRDAYEPMLAHIAKVNMIEFIVQG
jgi:hypothetical protein